MVYENAVTKYFTDEYVWPIDDLSQPSGEPDIKVGFLVLGAPDAISDQIHQWAKSGGQARLGSGWPIEDRYGGCLPQAFEHGRTDIREPMDRRRQWRNKRDLFIHWRLRRSACSRREFARRSGLA